MMFDTDDVPLGEEEEEAVKRNARKRFGLWRKRGLYSTAALISSCLFTYLFLEGSPLHAYWDSLGRYLMLLSIAFLLVFLYCAGLWWSAWRVLSDLGKDEI